jgi:hypothetical protein
MEREWMSVAELAWRLNVSIPYARSLLRSHALRPVRIVRRTRFVCRATAERYRDRHRKFARKALRELAMVSQEAGLY